VAAVEAWLRVAKIREGAMFRRRHRGDVISDKRLDDRAVAELINEVI
jgi:hypothetical protein